MSLWQKLDDVTLEMLKKQKAFEEETAERLAPLYNSLKTPLVKLFIRRIILDTIRHADMYQTLIDLNVRALVGETDRNMMAGELGAHIKEEKKMLDRAVEISMSVKDENFKKILERIIEDERKHHNILRELSEIIKKEEEDWNRYFYEIMKDFP